MRGKLAKQNYSAIISTKHFLEFLEKRRENGPFELTGE
jgi:hypothetical protein